MKKTILSLVILSGSTFAADIGLAVGPGGVTVDAGAAGKFTLPPPKLIVEGGAPKGEEGVMEAVDDTTLKIKFAAADATITVNQAGGSLGYTLAPKSGVQSLRVLMIIPAGFAQGGRFGFGGGDLKPLPATGGEQFLAQTTATEFQLVNAGGSGIRIATPDTAQELTDTRVFNMERFVYAVFLKAGTDENKWTLKFSAAAP